MIATLVVAALACVALAFVAAPLRGRDDRVTDRSPEVDEVVERKRAALTAILDMEEERDAGKLAQADFAVLRAEYEAEAAAALLELDALRMSGSSVDDALETEIAAIRARLQDDAPPVRTGADAEPCPSCGTPRAPGRACERCGA